MANSSGHQRHIGSVATANQQQQQQHQQLVAASKRNHAIARPPPPPTSHPYHRGHQRRQSVARLLPDISKLRLLSWLVEASSELINCDIAIMDGVYAKLNKSQESLLFWSSSTFGLCPSSSVSASASFASAPTPNSTRKCCPPNPSRASSNRLAQPAAPTPLSPPPPPPASQPVANSLVISQQQLKMRKLEKHLARSSGVNRSHHSLPLTSFSSLSPSTSASLGLVARRSSAGKQEQQQQPQQHLSLQPEEHHLPAPLRRQQSAVCSSQADSSDHPLAMLSYQNGTENNHSCDSSLSDNDEDDNSSAASSTTSSGIHGGGTSLGSSGSSASSVSASTSPTCPGAPATSSLARQHQQQQRSFVSSAEQLSEKIRRTVVEHNYLQSLLVNIIRQHDRQRDLLNQQRRRQLLSSPGDQFSPTYSSSNSNSSNKLQRIDLADIADALDDGCLCLCHSQPLGNDSARQQSGRANTLPVIGVAQNDETTSKRQSATSEFGQQQVPQRKARRLKKFRGSSGSANNSNELNRDEIISLLSDKLCENCFETHYWLRGCAADGEQISSPSPKLAQANLGATSGISSPISSVIGTCNKDQLQAQQQHQQLQQAGGSLDRDSNLELIIQKRNATFIKLVQQEVRSIISKSIELIDLIRREIKSPESIKQKQLMRCFSASIQLLTSVGNYVVPAQDISSILPEVGQQQATLFSLPPSDFDHLLLCPSNQVAQFHHQQQQNNFNYHLASAPDIPIRRRRRQMMPLNTLNDNGNNKNNNGQSSAASRRDQSAITSSSASLISSTSKASSNDRSHKQISSSSTVATAAALVEQMTTTTTPTTSSSSTTIEQALSSNLQRLKTTDVGSSATDPANQQHQSADSSSGASSNNSSASSSIARGTVQQSSLTRAQTSGAILDGKASHDLSFEAIASLSRQQTEDDMMFQARPKFWQSSKFNFIKKLLHVKEQRLLRQQSKDRRIYNNKVQNKFRLVMRDLTHFNKSQQLLTTENGVNSLLTSMRNVLEFGLYLTLKLY